MDRRRFLQMVATAPAVSAVLNGTKAAAQAETPRFFTLDELKKKYAQSPSRFVSVEGVPFHVREEGAGPPLILINGHLGNLFMWDLWMPALTPKFRVIRLDYAPYGLAGPDPSGEYGTDRTVALLDKLVAQLGVTKFHIGGTSNGALVATFYAIAHPQKVDRVVVSTLPAGRPPPRTPDPTLVAEARKSRDLGGYQTMAFFRAFLRDVFADPSRVTDRWIELYHDMNNREGSKAWVDAYIQSQYKMWDAIDIKAKYAQMKRPMLLQWGAGGRVLPRWVGDEVASLFPNAALKLTHYDKAGHMPMMEIPDETVREAIAFLDAKA
jgi:pimeloyl-ACP methyl ester carboxylesterase